MDIEQALETQRLRLLRIVAGLVAAVVFVSVGPFSREFPRWVRGFTLSILSRAESAAQYLVIAQAGLIAHRSRSRVDRRVLLDYAARPDAYCESDICPSTLIERLKALKALLENLPRHGLRLLRRTEKRAQRTTRARQSKRRPEIHASKALWDWRLVGKRIERPPERCWQQFCEQTSPRYRAGGENGWAVEF